MSTFDYLSAQNLTILLSGLVLGLVALALFMRKRANRHPMEGRQDRNVGADLDAGRKAPDHSPRI